MNDVWRNCIFPLVSPIDLARLRQSSKFLNRLLQDNEVLKEWKNRLSPLRVCTEEIAVKAAQTGHCDLVALTFVIRHFNPCVCAALRRGHINVVKFIRSLYTHSVTTWSQQDFLSSAIRSGNFDCIEWALTVSPPKQDISVSNRRLLVKQLQASNKDDLDNGVFGDALRGDENALAILKTQNQAVINSFLWVAARHNHARLVDFFIQRGARDFNYAMAGAAYGGHLDVIEYFTYRGANEWGPCMLSAEDGGHTETMKFFQRQVFLKNKILSL
jgi:hypothetical protein